MIDIKEYKFRGKRVNNGEFVYGSLFQFDEEYFIVISYIKPLGEDVSFVYFEVDPKTVGQSTGLTDKNKKEIYEWDVIRFGDRKMYVHFNEESLSWEMTDVGTPLNEVNHLINTLQLAEVTTESVICQKITTEVIGNIFDNPEFRMEF